MYLDYDDAERAAKRVSRITLKEHPDYQDRLDLLNISLKLAGAGVYCGYQRLTEPRIRERWTFTSVPTIEPGRVSNRPWGSWNERDGRKMSSFSRFENMEANIRDKMGL